MDKISQHKSLAMGKGLKGGKKSAAPVYAKGGAVKKASGKSGTSAGCSKY